MVLVESSRIHWVKNNQKQITAEKWSGLLDAVAENDLQNAGKRIILPPSIYGSPRFYQECFYDAMALVMHFGKPDYFITVTTNPNWTEIEKKVFFKDKKSKIDQILVQEFSRLNLIQSLMI